MTKRLILTLLSVLICGFSQAQTISVTATLRDAKSGEPMAFTNCVLLHTDSTFAYGTTTNDRGTMRFASVDSGEYLLRISTVGYETYWQRLNVPPDTALGVIEIFQSSTTLQAVSVTAQRPIYSASQSFVVFLYQSKFRPRRPPRKRASRPMLSCSEVSQVTSGLGTFLA